MAAAVLRRAAAAAAAATRPRAASSISRFTRSAAPPCAASSIDGPLIPRSAAPPCAASSTDGPLIPGLTDVAIIPGLTDGPLIPGLTDVALIPRADARLTRSAAFSRAPAGLLTTAPARFGGAIHTLTAPTTGLVRCFHTVAPLGRIDPHVLLALRRLDHGEYQRDKDVNETILKLTATLMADESHTLMFLTEQVIQVGSISWRACTTVLAVAVGAGFGLLQVTKTGWEQHFEESTRAHVVAAMADNKVHIEKYIQDTIDHKTAVSEAHKFLECQKNRERIARLEEREAVVAAREAVVAAREADFLAREAVPVKEVVSRMGWPWSR